MTPTAPGWYWAISVNEPQEARNLTMVEVRDLCCPDGIHRRAFWHGVMFAMDRFVFHAGPLEPPAIEPFPDPPDGGVSFSDMVRPTPPPPPARPYWGPPAFPPLGRYEGPYP